MPKRNSKLLVGDFETTVYEGQLSTEVWASAVVEVGTEDVIIHNSIGETWEYLVGLTVLKNDVIIYYHNLKFDGNFWIYFLKVVLGMKEAFYHENDLGTAGYFFKDKEMQDNTFKYLISDMGQWYCITIKKNNRFIYIKDSLKLMPFSVREIGKAFKTKHQKLEMEYEGLRYAGCEITAEEREYISNDVLVVKEALEIMFDEGHTKMTIGSCCLEEFRHLFNMDMPDSKQWDRFFPDLYSQAIKEDMFGERNMGDYIRHSYRGGWCYLVKGKENKHYKNGTTADVNSLYPSMMHSESGNEYPIGMPTFWTGNFIPDDALKKHRFYFIRIKTRFYLKEGMLPFIQIKGSYLYNGTDALETSDYYDKKTDKYYQKVKDRHGNIIDTIQTLTLTMMDYELIKKHYELVDFQILDGCYFSARAGLFDSYIDKYKQIKMTSKGAKRTLAKLFLNNLYGKMASSTKSSFKRAFIKEDGSIGFINIFENEKQGGYIPVGSAITSYARCFTINAAQANFYGVDKAGFIYADTDSIHCDIPADEFKGIKVDPNAFCCWKLETSWDDAIFIRQKTYIEHVTHEDLEPVEKPYYNVKCAGMPDVCKRLFLLSMCGKSIEVLQNECKQGLLKAEYGFDGEFDEKEIEFLSETRTLDDFTIGLRVPDKLLPKRIVGGVLLVNSYYEMR